MGLNPFEGQTLPFTKHGWKRQLKRGTFRNGATWEHVEKVKVLGRGTRGAKLEEVHILASLDIDQGGNKTINKRRGQHFLSLKTGADELAFAIRNRYNKNGWLILTYDCSCLRVVDTQHEAEEILVATNWWKWKKKRGGKN